MKATLPTDAPTWNAVVVMLLSLLSENIGSGMISQESGPQENDNELAIFSFVTGNVYYLVTLTAMRNEYGPYYSVMAQTVNDEPNGPIIEASTDWRLYL